MQQKGLNLCHIQMFLMLPLRQNDPQPQLSIMLYYRISLQ
jgi:hypothetical protein